ncbi:permease-like cell division protein FtsX [Actinomycetes bacterium KLBMP 9797]
MSDFPHPPPAAPGRPPRRWLLPVLVGAMALLVGAAGATTAFLLLDRRAEAQSHYAVTVFLEQDATAAQRDALSDALDDLSGAEDIAFRTREEAYALFKEQYKDEPDILDDVRPESLPESFRFTKTGTDVDCASLKPVYDLPGVADISVLQYPTQEDLGGPVKCF